MTVRVEYASSVPNRDNYTHGYAFIKERLGDVCLRLVPSEVSGIQNDIASALYAVFVRVLLPSQEVVVFVGATHADPSPSKALQQVRPYYSDSAEITMVSCMLPSVDRRRVAYVDQTVRKVSGSYLDSNNDYIPSWVWSHNKTKELEDPERDRLFAEKMRANGRTTFYFPSLPAEPKQPQTEHERVLADIASVRKARDVRRDNWAARLNELAKQENAGLRHRTAFQARMLLKELMERDAPPPGSFSPSKHGVFFGWLRTDGRRLEVAIKKNGPMFRLARGGEPSSQLEVFSGRPIDDPDWLGFVVRLVESR
jgi:hypothetical protein